MKTTIQYKDTGYLIDLSEPLDISIPLRGNASNVNAWYLDPPRITPHDMGGKAGLVAEGAAVNFNDIWFNPHVHGTHTECVGHISREVYSVNIQLRRYFHSAVLITLGPEKFRDDLVISARQLENALKGVACEAVVIRTLPNTPEKLSRQYSHTNPPYLLEEATRYLAGNGFDHLLIDLPSVDKEQDEGALAAHKAFWNFDGPLRMHATITELVYVPNEIADGCYFLDLQTAPFENDATPSRPVLYKVLQP